MYTFTSHTVSLDLCELKQYIPVYYYIVVIRALKVVLDDESNQEFLSNVLISHVSIPMYSKIL